ncbi:MAG TPA: DUF6458 family protein [Acidimicrobiia bacterium]|nr:DUF6458 family protein [Acidimicrobiia bacterium]
MAFGTSIVLFALGAVLVYGVETDVDGINLDAIGVILMIVAAVGFLLSALFWASWAPFGRERRVEQSELIREHNGELTDHEIRRTSRA